MKKKQIDKQFIQVADYLQNSQKLPDNNNDNKQQKKNINLEIKQEQIGNLQYNKNESPQKWLNNQSTSASLKQQNTNPKFQQSTNYNSNNTPKGQQLEYQVADKAMQMSNLEKIKENLNKKLQCDQLQQFGGNSSGGGGGGLCQSGKQSQSQKNCNQIQIDFLKNSKDTSQIQEHGRLLSNDNKNEYNFINSTNIIFEKLKKKKLSTNQNSSNPQINYSQNNLGQNNAGNSRQQLQKTLNNSIAVKSHHTSMLNINQINGNNHSQNNCNTTADTSKGHRKVCSLTTFQPKVNKENMFIDLSKQQYNIISQIDLKKFINNRQQKDVIQKCGSGSCNNSITNNNNNNSTQSNTFNGTCLNNYFSPQNQSVVNNNVNNSKREIISRQQSQKKQLSNQSSQQMQLQQTISQTNHNSQKLNNNSNNSGNNNQSAIDNYSIIHNNNLQQIYNVQNRLEDIVKNNNNKLDENNYMDIMEQVENIINIDTNLKSCVKLIKDSLNMIFQKLIQKNQNLQISAMKGDSYKKDVENLTKERNLLKNKIQYIEKENQKFEQMIASKNSIKQQDKSTQTKKSINDQNIEILKENNILKEYIIEQEKKIQLFKEKESKMIKLLLAIQRRGVDIDSIYNNDVLNEDDVSASEDQNQEQVLLKKPIDDDPVIKQFLIQEDATKTGYADNSIINDSDESSFNYYGKPSSRDQSIINLDYVKNFNKVIPETQPKLNSQMQQKLQLNLMEIQKQKLENPSSDSGNPQQQQQQQMQHQSQNKQPIAQFNVQNIQIEKDNIQKQKIKKNDTNQFNNQVNQINIDQLLLNRDKSSCNQYASNLIDKNGKQINQQQGQMIIPNFQKNQNANQDDFISGSQEQEEYSQENNNNNFQIIQDDFNNSWNFDSDIHQQSF